MNSEKNSWPDIHCNPLPPDVAHLPTIEAEPWVLIGEEPLCTEGPMFDAEGNLYVCVGVPEPDIIPKIVKVTPERKVTTFYTATANELPVGLAQHKDSRIFAAAMAGGIAIIGIDGKLERLVDPVYEDGTRAMPNDCVFDAAGNLYFTDYRGNVSNPCGAVARLEADSGYTKITKVVGNLLEPNGIAFSPDFRTLWVAETNRNAILQIHLDETGAVRTKGETINYVYYNTGLPMPDGCKVDSAGNLYQAMMMGGRVLILNPWGIPLANVVTPKRETNAYFRTSNLILKPNSSEGYMLGNGPEGMWVFRFPTLAPAQKLFPEL